MNIFNYVNSLSLSLSLSLQEIRGGKSYEKVSIVSLYCPNLNERELGLHLITLVGSTRGRKLNS